MDLNGIKLVHKRKYKDGTGHTVMYCIYCGILCPKYHNCKKFKDLEAKQ